LVPEVRGGVCTAGVSGRRQTVALFSVKCVTAPCFLSLQVVLLRGREGKRRKPDGLTFEFQEWGAALGDLADARAGAGQVKLAIFDE